LALTPGTRIGAYEVLALLGAGGMGEVYRARDATLNRDVALKVLSASLTHDSNRTARLRREAQVLAALNHPHIGGIYGLEDADGITALVLELVEGPTLADRIAQGAVPLDEALSIARQITDALEAAHEQGIVHRDLKPANIKLRPDGTVKVLDFGLAKAVEPASSSPDAAHVPTITAMEPSLVGAIFGTPAYMSPEQAAGKSVDKRTDIWAFGVVLLEMLTGARVFTGESVTHMLAAVLRAEPDWSTLPPDTPATIRRLLRRCLEKDRKRRLDSAAAVRLELEEAQAPPAAADAPTPARRPIAPVVLASMAAGALLATLVVWAVTRPSPPAAPSSTRFTITPPAALFLQPSLQAGARDFAVAPDGSFLVYRAGSQGQLAVRWFDRLDVSPIAGVTGAAMPFVSPDSQWIGFVEDDLTLKKVAVSGGAPVTLARLPVWPRGASWVDAATIIIGTNSQTTGLLRVPAGGGDPVVLTTPDRSRGEEGHVLPSALPGGRAMLFTVGAAAAKDLVDTPFEEWNGEVSPDGRFLAYQSDESGEIEIYVRPFPAVATARWLVSSGGGTRPVWTRGGRELIYLDAKRCVAAVAIDTAGAGFRAGPPTTLVRTAYAAPGPWRTYDVSPDGQRFLVMKQDRTPQDATPPGFVVVQHWLDELRRLAPSK